jgi:hypothetical protein
MGHAFFLNSPQYSGLNGKNGSTTVWHTLGLWMEELLLIWRVALNILHKQLQSAGKGLSSSLGFSRVFTAPLCKNLPFYKSFTNALDLD